MPSNKAQNNIITVRGRERSLTPKQKSLFSNLGNYGIDLSSLKKDNIHINKKLFFEIGFGSGDIIHKQAKLNPDNIYIGIEYYRKGIAQLIEKIEKTNLNNLKDKKVKLGVRSEFIKIADNQKENLVDVDVDKVEDFGNYKLLTAKMGNFIIKSKVKREIEVPSNNVKLHITAEK